MLGEREAGELLPEIFHHVVALEFAVYEHIQPDVFLQGDGLADLRLDEAVVFLRCELAIVELPARRTHFGGLRE